jgi:hypothetical protein
VRGEKRAAVVPQGAHINMAPVFAVMMRACCRGTWAFKRSALSYKAGSCGARTRSYSKARADARTTTGVTCGSAGAGVARGVRCVVCFHASEV